MQHLRGAEPVEDRGAETLLPRRADLRRQRLAGRDREAQPRRAVPVPDTGRLAVPRRAGAVLPASRAALVRAGGLREHRAVERRHAKENGRPVLAQERRHRVRRRAAGEDHGGRTDVEREGHRVAQPVGEEELGGGEDEIVLPDPERRHPVVLGGGDQVAVQVHRALRDAGGTGGIEPERDVVAGGGRRGEPRRYRREEIVEPEIMDGAGPGLRPRAGEEGSGPCPARGRRRAPRLPPPRPAGRVADSSSAGANRSSNASLTTAIRARESCRRWA